MFNPNEVPNPHASTPSIPPVENDAVAVEIECWEGGGTGRAVDSKDVRAEEDEAAEVGCCFEGAAEEREGPEMRFDE